MLPRCLAIILWLACASSSLAATAADFIGTWTWVLPNRNNQPFDYSLQLVAAGTNQLSGTYFGRVGPQPIVNVAIGNDLTFAVISNTPNGDVSVSYTLSTSGVLTIRTPAGGLPSGVQIDTVTAKRAGSPEITSFVLPSAALVGQPITFSIVATGNAPLTYQWRKNSSPISGATNVNYAIPSVQLSDGGSYSCTVTNGVGNVTSPAVNLVVSAPPPPVIPVAPPVNPPTTIPPTTIPPPTTTPTTPTTPVTPPRGNPPTFASSPGESVLSLRSSTMISYGALGDQPITYQWRKDGVPIPGATSGLLTIANVQHSDAGTYTLVATNAAGTTISPPLVIRIRLVPPTISVQPRSVALIEGAPLTLSTTATGDPTPTFQWFKNGVAYSNPVTGPTTATLSLGGTTMDDAGDYTCAITNDAGTVTTTTATVTITRAARIVNISSRGYADSDGLTAGFVVDGYGPVQTLVRAAGPGLAEFGVGATLPNPVLRLSSPTLVVNENDDWRPELMSTFTAVGAFPFRPGSTDSAFLTQLQSGAFTATVRDRENRSGEVLLEVYHASAGESRGGFVNVSTLGSVAPGRAIASGFVILGDGAITVLVRAIGPALAPFGVSNGLPAPQLELFSGATRLAQNAGWSRAANVAAIPAATTRAGAFPLPDNSSDAAILIDLAAGSYTVQTAGIGSASGRVLFELYLIR